MNAARALRPTNDTAPEQVSDLEAAYRRAISIHYPTTDALTMAIRVNLMGVRDRAALALNRCCEEALPTLAEANRLASLAALSGAPTRTLAFTLSAVESLIFAAQQLQRSGS